VLHAATPASAQSAQGSRVFRGLFGPTEKEQVRPRQLDVTWSLYNAADDNSFLTTDSDILDQTLQTGRVYSGATISMTYTRRPPRRLMSFSATSAARYYPALHQIVSTRYGGGASLDLLPARDWRVQWSGNASYSPYYEAVLTSAAPALATVDVPVSSADYAAAKRHSMLYGSYLAVSHAYSERAVLTLNYAARYTQFFDGADLNRQRGGAQFNYTFAKDLTLRLGYAYGISTTGVRSVPALRNNDIDAGVNYGKTFSPSHRTSFGFSTGSTIVSAEDGRHFRITGSGHLTRRLSPRWTAQLLYDRGLQVPDGATRPFFADSIGATLSGYVNSRVSLRAQPAFAHGVVGFHGATNTYNSLTSSTRVEVALTHQLALYAEHFYYRYQFANGDGLPPLLLTGMERQGARAGLTLWTPLVR
jgi:hypothetical protein